MNVKPEVWLRGPVERVPLSLQPIAHALLQAREDLDRLLGDLPSDLLLQRAGGAASIAFHVRHLAGSLDRLLAYARGEELSNEQRRTLAEEKEEMSDARASDLLELAHRTIDNALEQLRKIDETTLDEPRAVGRAELPSSVRGLLFHAMEHTTRHVGQISTTKRVLLG